MNAGGKALLTMGVAWSCLGGSNTSPVISETRTYNAPSHQQERPRGDNVTEALPNCGQQPINTGQLKIAPQEPEIGCQHTKQQRQIVSFTSAICRERALLEDLQLVGKLGGKSATAFKGAQDACREHWTFELTMQQTENSFLLLFCLQLTGKEASQFASNSQ